jgi:hypothetical protein
MNKLLLAASLIILVFVVIPLLVWNINYIDETITDGEKHGFVVGESMQQVFERIKTDAKEASYKAVQVGDSPKDFRIIRIDELQLSSIEDYSSWLVMLDSASEFLNTIRLDFNGDKLASIRRHKKLFELP